ncbi:MAG: alpha-L-rhamnosidase, partial [Lentisphaeria bacterium]|nr:alpha-L-rhamnosidase [Lentisphaeria bacterium]
MTDMTFTVKPKALVQTEVAPAESRLLRDGTLFLDFGKAAFGTLIVPVAPDQESVTVCLGEKLGADGRIDREPPGTIRFIRIEQSVGEGEASCRIIIPSDPRNTGPVAIKMPSDIGEVYPFRYAEIKDPGDMDPSAVRQVCVHYPFDEAASSFQSSDSVLNAVWELCKYSIKATTFCGVYVDGDRERIPYEGDAYINQLGHYAVDCEYALARYTHEYLIQHPTWPTEWQLHSVMMAWADYMYTGETQSLETFYDDLCVKTLVGLAREDGLISTESELCTRKFEERLHLHYSPHVSGNGLKDLVDWPPGSFTEGGAGERDNHEMLPVNTVVNAFHYHALALMSRIADVLGRSGDRERFASQAAKVKSAINRLLYDEAQGVYVDGEGAKHASLHSNMTVLAFGLVPEERIPTVVSHVKSRGMACSVYGAQYLLEALYLSGEDACALGLMTAKSERSWWNMMQIGSTITLEAWDWKYKSDLDWNHAWGAVPANIIPRFLMGVRPLEAGFAKVLIQPRPGGLETARIKIPTIRGTIAVGFENHPEKPFVLEVDIPRDMTARIDIPALGRPGSDVVVD